MQNFWAIVNNKTLKISRNMSGYNVFPTRDTARKNLILQMKSKSGNYSVEKLLIDSFDEIQGGYVRFGSRDIN